MTRTRLLVVAAALASVFVLAANASWTAPPPARSWAWMAHRGVAQSFPLDGVDGDTCTASRIRPPTHELLENTLPSMRAAFALGAAAVELDLHQSLDGELVVFHDATLDCRTDGHGAPEDQPLAALRALDLGYGYTADAGSTFPLRGKGVGLLPTAAEVLAAFPDRTLILHFKTDDPVAGERLAALLAARPKDERARRIVYGGARPMAEAMRRVPELRGIDKTTIKACLGGYLAAGWTGWLPEACHHTVVALPVSDAHWLWGWPRRFDARMAGVGTQVLLVGDRSAAGWVGGVDDDGARATIPDDFDGWVWTNRIDAVAQPPPSAPR